MPAPRRPRVVIVGAGFAGLRAARALEKVPADVLVLDRTNYHKFQPLLYQVATAALQPGQIAQPVRHAFQGQANVRFEMGTVARVDPEARAVEVADGRRIEYDYLVVAAGASTAYFGVEGAEEYAFPLKNLPDAIALRGHTVERFEAAAEAPARIDAGALTFVIVGGGATGVEMAGALVELIDRVFARDYPALDIRRARVLLLEREAALMAGYADDLRAYTRRVLEQRGVEVRTGVVVERVTPGAVILEGGEEILTETCVWGAGVEAHPLAGQMGLEQTRAGRVAVDDRLHPRGYDTIWVTGDVAGAAGPEGKLYPQVAQVAIQQGRHAAESIARRIAGEAERPFRYRDLGIMATIGRNAAIAQFPGGAKLRGRLAWMAWAGIHVAKLVGFRNRAGVFLSWAYNYFTYDRGPRLILPARPESDRLPPADAPPDQDTRSVPSTA